MWKIRRKSGQPKCENFDNLFVDSSELQQVLSIIDRGIAGCKSSEFLLNLASCLDLCKEYSGYNTVGSVVWENQQVMSKLGKLTVKDHTIQHRVPRGSFSRLPGSSQRSNLFEIDGDAGLMMLLHINQHL